MLTNNGQATFITRKSVRKLNKPLSNNQLPNENCHSLALNIHKSNGNFKMKTHLSREPLTNFKSNSNADSEIVLNLEESKMKNNDICLNSFVKVICDSSKVIREAVERSGISEERMGRIEFLLSNKYDYQMKKSIDIEKIILEEIEKECEKIKLEEACLNRQKNIARLIEDRIGRLESLIVP